MANFCEIYGYISYRGHAPDFQPLVDAILANNKYRLPSYSLVNLGVAYQTSVAHHPVTLRAGVDNVFNRNYWGFLASGYTFVGAPRTVGVNAKIEL